MYDFVGNSEVEAGNSSLAFPFIIFKKNVIHILSKYFEIKQDYVYIFDTKRAMAEMIL